MLALTVARGSSTFSALQHHEFRLLFAGLVASNVGVWMQQFALGWLIVEIALRQGRPDLAGFYLGLRSLASAAPALVFGLLAGVLADRMDRRNLLIVTRVATSLIAAVLALIVISGHASLVVVILLSAAASAAFAFDPPGRQAILPMVVPARDLFSAMGLSRAAMQVAHTVGPLVAGLLIVPIGVGGVLLTKAGLAAMSIGALVPMQPRPPHHSARSIGLLSALREGLSYIRRDELIRWCILLQVVFAVFAQSFMQLLPAIAVESLKVGVVELSWLTAATGVGALAGAFLIPQVGGIERRGVVLLMALLAAGTLLVLLGLQRELVGALAVLGMLGVVQQIYMGTQTVILQIAAPDRLRGRVLGMQSVIFMGFGPLGVLAVGTLGTLIGISTAISVAGAAVVCVAVAAYVRLHAVRDLRRSSETTTRAPTPPRVIPDIAAGGD